MRKITSGYKEEKRKRKNGIIVGIILISVMLFSVIGYSLGGKDEENDLKKLDYNGFEFIEQNKFWVTNVGDFQFVFKYNPEQIETINSNLNSLSNYQNKPLYISSESSEAELEIYRNLFYQTQIVQRMQSACLEHGCDENSPTKTCEDNFIIIKESNVSEIIQEDNCVFISGPQTNLTMITDEFLFRIIGIR